MIFVFEWGCWFYKRWEEIKREDSSQPLSIHTEKGKKILSEGTHSTGYIPSRIDTSLHKHGWK